MDSYSLGSDRVGIGAHSSRQTEAAAPTAVQEARTFADGREDIRDPCTITRSCEECVKHLVLAPAQRVDGTVAGYPLRNTTRHHSSGPLSCIGRDMK